MVQIELGPMWPVKGLVLLLNYNRPVGSFLS